MQMTKFRKQKNVQRLPVMGNSVDPDEATHYEPPLYLCCMQIQIFSYFCLKHLKPVILVTYADSDISDQRMQQLIKSYTVCIEIKEFLWKNIR